MGGGESKRERVGSGERDRQEIKGITMEEKQNSFEQPKGKANLSL